MSVVVLFVAAGGFNSLAHAAKTADPTGTWKWERKRDDRTDVSVLKLELKDKLLTDLYKGYGVELKVEKGKVEKDRLSFQLSFEQDGQTRLVTFQGKVGQDKITGAVELDFGETRKFDWTARRTVEISDVLGFWKIDISTNDGEILDSSLKLTAASKQESHKVKGIFTSRYGVTEIKNFKLEKNVLTYNVLYDQDGRRLAVKFRVRPRGNSVVGSLDYDLNGEQDTLDFIGKRVEKKKTDKPKKKSE